MPAAGSGRAIAGSAVASRGRRRPVRRMIRRFLRLPRGRKLVLVEAIASLAVARLALLFVPFRTLAAGFGSVGSPLDTPARPAAPVQLADIQAIGWAVTRAARYVPFRAVCLPQAIAAKSMLDRRGIACVMHFGVAKNDDSPLDAHAWLDAGEIEVTGYPVGPQFVEVARFL